MIDALPNDTQVVWLLLLFCKKNADEYTVNIPLNQVSQASLAMHADIARQPFHVYSCYLKVNVAECSLLQCYILL